MKLGILADIHEQVDYLKLSLAQLKRASVDQVVVLGDIFYTGTRIDETVSLLEERARPR